MKKLLLGLTCFCTVAAVNASEWVTLDPSDLLQVEVYQTGADAGKSEGVYFRAESDFSTTLTCSKKHTVVLTDATIADRALSMGMFAPSSGKTMQFYVTGCDNDHLLGKAVQFKQ